MRAACTFLLLLLTKVWSRAFFRFDVHWVSEPKAEKWSGLRLAALLNHTSLYEVIFFGIIPNRVLWQFARRGVVPGADKTLARPWVGLFFRLVAYRVISITRRRDHTWSHFMDQIGSDALVVMAPEGRMMRPGGLDLEGRPMTVRGGIADVVEALGEGQMLIAYSGGLHHVQAPGERLPRLFQTVRLRLEQLDIAETRRRLTNGQEGFKAALIADLERRRDLHCPTPDSDPPGLDPRNRLDSETGESRQLRVEKNHGAYDMSHRININDFWLDGKNQERLVNQTPIQKY